MNLSFRVNFLRFDIGRYSGELADHLEIVAKEGARKYLEIMNDLVPRWTGMLRDSFRNIEVALNRSFPSRQPLKAPNDLSRLFRTSDGGGGGTRRGNIGRNYGTPPEQIFGDSDRNNILTTGRTTNPADIFRPGFIQLFHYNVNLLYYDLLDPVLWHSQSVAEEVFKTHIAFNLRIPELRDFIVEVTNGEGVTINRG